VASGHAADLARAQGAADETHLALLCVRGVVGLATTARGDPVRESKGREKRRLIERVAGIFARLPVAGGGGLRLRRTEAPPKLVLVDNESMILGVAEGLDQVVKTRDGNEPPI
jgi:hypothetical protein